MLESNAMAEQLQHVQVIFHVRLDMLHKELFIVLIYYWVAKYFPDSSGIAIWSRVPVHANTSV